MSTPARNGGNAKFQTGAICLFSVVTPQLRAVRFSPVDSAEGWRRVGGGVGGLENRYDPWSLGSEYLLAGFTNASVRLLV